LVDDLLDYSEPEAHAVSSPRIKHVEESLTVRGADAGTLIYDFQERTARFVAPSADLDLAAARRRLYCVLDEIPNDLSHAIRVDCHDDRLLGSDLIDLETIARRRFAPGHGNHLACDLAKVEWLGCYLTRASHL
jgi:hypothetical protein